MEKNTSLENTVSTELSQNKVESFSFLPSSAIVSKSLPPSTKQGGNSIYSFNKNYTKNLPSVDIAVRKTIRNFFSVNPLAYNANGKKSRLVQRRFKRLSLNRIFISKPEIKHSNNKVFITVYLFNKKKKSLVYKMKDLYNSIPYKHNKLHRNSNLLNTGISRTVEGYRYQDMYSKLLSTTKSQSFLENTTPLSLDTKNTSHPLVITFGEKANETSFLSVPSHAFLYLYNKNKLTNHKERREWLKRIKTQPLGLNSKISRSKNITSRTTKRNMKSIIILQRIRKINDFFKKYETLFKDKEQSLSADVKSVVASYKLNYVKDILSRELLYLYYAKMLSFTNVIFKNWFLTSLRNVLSKIYNKKVILNLVSLKYLHLNSDIFMQAITVRLRNYKKNRLNKVLRKALKLVSLSRINIYSYDRHSAVNKFIENYYKRFTSLRTDIFNDVLGKSNNSVLSDKSYESYDLDSSTLNGTLPSTEKKSYSLPAIRGLYNKRYFQQSHTINFIRHKSVFGVRLEAAGRLTKRSTASRAVFKIRNKGNLRNNSTINRKDTSTIIGNHMISNLQFTKISSKTRNGSFGLKGWLNNN